MYLESAARLASLALPCAIKAIQLKPECYLSSVICLPKVKVLYGSFFLYCFCFRIFIVSVFYLLFLLISFRSVFNEFV